MRHGLPLLALLALHGCSDRDSTRDSSSNAGSVVTGPSQTQKQTQAQEEAAKAEAERQAEEMALEAERQAFCGMWARLVCRDALRCHPDSTEDSYTGCMLYKETYCAHFLPEDANLDAGEACFAETVTYDCNGTLAEYFEEHCGSVLSDGSGQDGSSCTTPSECAPGLKCVKTESNSCRGICEIQVEAGEDCSEHPCEDGLECMAENDEDGFDIFVCRTETAPEDEPEPAASGGGSDCEPWEFLASDGTCRTRALPGERCGGEFEVPCVGHATCDKSESGTDTGTCKPRELGLGRMCSGYCGSPWMTCFESAMSLTGGRCDWGGPQATFDCQGEHALELDR